MPYTLDEETRAFLPTFVKAINTPFWQQMNGEGPDEESSKEEVFLLEELCSTYGTLDLDRILSHLEDEEKHLPVMASLACLLRYDLDVRDVEEYLETEEEMKMLRKFCGALCAIA